MLVQPLLSARRENLHVCILDQPFTRQFTKHLRCEKSALFGEYFARDSSIREYWGDFFISQFPLIPSISRLTTPDLSVIHIEQLAFSAISLSHLTKRLSEIRQHQAREDIFMHSV